MLLRVVVALASAALAVATVAVFVAFDRDSHSASDTLRPFLITTAPVWVAAVALATLVLRRSKA